MIRPRAFGFNTETALDNAFQINPGEEVGKPEAQAAAVEEFDRLSSLLSCNGIEVNVETDTDFPETPDAIFPNNWISFHNPFEISSSTHPSALILYPMMSPIRRQERRQDLVTKWTQGLDAKVIDLSGFETSKEYLEGTGSMVLDRVNRIVYACISARTNPKMIEHFCSITGYNSLTFHAYHKSADGNIAPIYHTNVMMTIGSKFVMICLESIHDATERKSVEESLRASGRTIIPVTSSQVSLFLCNALELCNKDGQSFVVLSTTAYAALDESQRKSLTEESNLKLLHCSVDTVQALGGGGVRCMIAEIFPPK